MCKKSAFPSIGWKHRAVTYLGEGYEFGEKELFRSEHVVVIMEGDSFRLVVEPGVTQEEVDVAIEKGGLSLRKHPSSWPVKGPGRSS